MRANPRNMQSEDYILKEGYVYTANFGTVNAGTTATAVVRLDTDADFFITKGTYFCINANEDSPQYNEFPMPNCTVQIQDTSSGMQLFREAVPVPSVFGIGREPFIWPMPYGVQRGGTLEFTLQNNTAGTNYAQFYLNLAGVKTYLRTAM